MEELSPNHNHKDIEDLENYDDSEGNISQHRSKYQSNQYLVSPNSTLLNILKEKCQNSLNNSFQFEKQFSPRKSFDEFHHQQLSKLLKQSQQIEGIFLKKIIQQQLQYLIENHIHDHQKLLSDVVLVLEGCKNNFSLIKSELEKSQLILASIKNNENEECYLGSITEEYEEEESSFRKAQQGKCQRINQLLNIVHGYLGVEQKMKALRQKIEDVKIYEQSRIRTIKEENDQLIEKIYEIDQYKLKTSSLILSQNKKLQDDDKEIIMLKNQIQLLKQQKNSLEQRLVPQEEVQKLKQELEEKNLYFNKCEEVLEQKNRNQELLAQQLQQARQIINGGMYQNENDKKDQLISKLMEENKNLKKVNEDLKYMNGIFKKDSFTLSKTQRKWSKMEPNFKSKDLNQKLNKTIEYGENRFKMEKKSKFSTPITQRLRLKYNLF